MGSRRSSLVSAVATRLLDVLLTTVVLIISAPVLAAAALAVRATTPGPAFFRQVRVGVGGAPFVIWKFRTMHEGADEAPHRAFVTQQFDRSGAEKRVGEIFKLTHDDRVTRVGGFLRRTSIDELPQLLNVLRGDMSLVGPRPVLPWEVALFAPRHMCRFSVKPGITGLWQVSGRSTLTFGQALDLDVEYVRRRSLRLDATILLRTIPAVVSRRGAW